MKKPIAFDFDLLVIGSGAAGGVAAHLASGYGKKIGLIEEDKLGGDCPNYSCVPTKTLLSAAYALQTIQQAPKYGLKATTASYNLRSLMAQKDAVVKAANGENSGRAFASENIRVIRGHAHFLSPWVITVGSHRYSARKFLIATGSTINIPDITGLNDAGFITYKEATDLTKLPKSIAIVGGGATAYEFSQIFSTFGVKVYVLEQHKHLLNREDVEVGDITASVLESSGVRVKTSIKINSITGSHGRKTITYEQHGQKHRIVVEEIMVASGKKPNLDIGLENTGIRHSESSIKVNSHMETSKDHIYAAGDVTGGDLFAHSAIQQARIAAHNMFHRNKIPMDYSAVPRIFYGTPEVAAVGKTEHQLIMTGAMYQTAIAPIGIVGKAATTNYDSGFVKLLAAHNGVLLGASVVAPNASEFLTELTFAIQHYHRACDIAQTIHGFPTWSEAVRVAASRIECI